LNRRIQYPQTPSQSPGLYGLVGGGGASSSTMSADSFIVHEHSPSTENDDVDSLPSISSSILDSEDESDAQQEWERSLEQLQLLLTMVIIPFAGKYFGRKFAYWSKALFRFYPQLANRSIRLG
jgi:hypothetical protein